MLRRPVLLVMATGRVVWPELDSHFWLDFEPTGSELAGSWLVGSGLTGFEQAGFEVTGFELVGSGPEFIRYWAFGGLPGHLLLMAVFAGWPGHL